jgi:class 3 adenylate cyclase
MPSESVAAILAELDARDSPVLTLLARYHAPEYLPIWREAPTLYRRFAKRLIAQGNPGPALDLVCEGLTDGGHGGDLDLLFFQALALARGGNISGTQKMVASLLAQSHLPQRLQVEGLSLYGRTLKDAYHQERDPRRKERLAFQSAGYYEQAHALTEDPFPGVNAATMFLLAAEPQRSGDLAQRAAERAIELAELPENAQDYWLQASLGEAYLLLGKTARAAGHYGEAVKRAGKDHGSLATMCNQLRMLREKLPDEVELLLSLFQVGSVVVFAGHRIDSPRKTEAGLVRFPASDALEEAVKQAIARDLDHLDPIVGYCAPSCGADLLFAELMLQRKKELHVVLPFDRDDFFRTRVDYEEASMRPWRDRCLAVLDQATVHHAIKEEFLDDLVLFEFADRFMQGLALARAAQLGAQARALLVLDTTAGQQSGTALFQSEWEKAVGTQACLIELGNLREQAGLSSPAPAVPVQARPRARKREVRAMLFADVKNFSKLKERDAPAFFLAFLRQVHRVISRGPIKPLFSNTWGDGLYVVTQDVRSAADLALCLLQDLGELDWQQLGLPKDTGVRIGLHTGPVFKGPDPIIEKDNYFGSHVSRAARIEPVTVPGCAFASEQFAACLNIEAPDAFACEYLGVHDLAKDYDRVPLYRVVRR